VRPSFFDSHSQNACASYQLMPVTYGESGSDVPMAAWNARNCSTVTSVSAM